MFGSTDKQRKEIPRPPDTPQSNGGGAVETRKERGAKIRKQVESTFRALARDIEEEEKGAA